MSDIDLTEAIEAGARAEGDHSLRGAGFDGFTPGSQHGFRLTARRILTAALPYIARQIREQVAREIEATDARLAAQGWDDPYTRRRRDGLAEAAEIARGDS